MAEIADTSKHLPVVWIEDSAHEAGAISIGGEPLDRTDGTPCFRTSYEEVIGLPKAAADVPAAALILVVPRGERIHNSSLSRLWSKLVESAAHSTAVVALAYDSTLEGWHAWLEGSAQFFDVSSAQGRGEMQRLIRAALALENTQILPPVLPAQLQRIRFAFERLVRTQPLTAAALKLAVCDQLDVAGVSKRLGIEATSAESRLEFARHRLRAVCPLSSADDDVIREALQPKRSDSSISGGGATAGLSPTQTASGRTTKPSRLQRLLQSRLAERSTKVRRWFRRCAQLLEAGMPVEVVVGYSWALVEQLMRRSYYICLRAEGKIAREAIALSQVEHLSWKDFQSSLGVPMPAALTSQAFHRAKLTRDKFLHGRSFASRGGPTGSDMADSCHAIWIWSQALDEWMTSNFGIGPLDDLRRIPKRARTASLQMTGLSGTTKTSAASESLSKRTVPRSQALLDAGSIWSAVERAGLARTSHDLSNVPHDEREYALRAAMRVRQAAGRSRKRVSKPLGLEQLVVVHTATWTLVLQECRLDSSGSALEALNRQARALQPSGRASTVDGKLVVRMLVMRDATLKALCRLDSDVQWKLLDRQGVLCGSSANLRSLLKQAVHPEARQESGGQRDMPAPHRRSRRILQTLAAYDLGGSAVCLDLLRKQLDQMGWHDIELPSVGKPVPPQIRHEILERTGALGSRLGAGRFTAVVRARRGAIEGGLARS